MCGPGAPRTPAQGDCPALPPRGVLRDWSRPVPGSCRGVVSPLTGGFPHTVMTRMSRFLHAGNGSGSRRSTVTDSSGPSGENRVLRTAVQLSCIRLREHGRHARKWFPISSAIAGY